MELAKNHLDVGLFTNSLEPMLEFWQQQVGLPFEEVLATGGGSQQHRHAFGGGVLKINHVRDPLPEAPPSGYRELLLAREGIVEPREMTDPDGNRMKLVPPGFEGVTSTGVVVAVSSLANARAYYGRALGWEQRSEATFACGETVLFLRHDATITTQADSMRAPGYRYLTVQVRDCDAEYNTILQRGGSSGVPPRTMGAVARFGFVRDPDGNWLEVSQRASLTGPLPPN
jgi:lactoylglutathione lyase